MRQLNMEFINLINHEYNRNSICVGDTVVVDIGYRYSAIVEGLKLDLKNKKMFAFLKTFNKRCPIRVDVVDCKKIENNI